MKKGKGQGWPDESKRHAMSRMGYKTVLPDGRRFHMGDFVAGGSRVNIDWDKDYLTEAEINLIKNRKNRGEGESMDEFYERIEDTDGFEITPEQTKKGFNWLWNLYKTPRGIERKNNPFGYREEQILENFDRFTIVDFYNAGNMYHDFYVPYYRVYGNNGAWFEYTVYGGEIHILG